MSTPKIGELAPDFTLEGWGSEEVSEYTLSARRGQSVVLAFYPGDDTAVCTKQLCSYSDDMAAFKDLGAEVWGISPQGIASHQAFAQKRNLNFPLLADEAKEVISLYGVQSPLGVKRSVFVIGPDGKVVWSHVALIGLTYQNSETLKAAISAAGSSN